MAATVHTSPFDEAPAWAVLQRTLIAELDAAWPKFVERYCLPDGRLRFGRALDGRDGVDDFYEAFFNWPTLYALGGDRGALAASKRHWTGVTDQLTELGMLTAEFENGYDWFHQGESLIFFYALCAADPADPGFRARAARFAALYTDTAHGNYRPDGNVIGAPHNGALGLRSGLGPEWTTVPASMRGMQVYGLPLEYEPGIERWDDLADPANAEAMGRAMSERAVGDVVVNLAATSLVANHWLYDGDPIAAEWVLRYFAGWRDRALANGGLIPDNVGPDGTTGTAHDGRWYGGHYGWSWPHGLLSVGSATVIGGINAWLVDGDEGHFDLARALIDNALDHAITASVRDAAGSLAEDWIERLGEDADRPAMLVPYRYGRDGWHDYHPMPLELPTWIWWITRAPEDLARLQRVIDGIPGSHTDVKQFRDKEEAGHGLPWLTFLSGTNPDYPERALEMALGQVAGRLALMEADREDPARYHVHHWQQVQPVVTEVLGQLVFGAPPAIYNGGLPMTAVSYDDVDLGRPGLPPDVAALVTSVGCNRVALSLVNLSPSRARRIRLRPGRFGERDIVAVESGGVHQPVGAPSLLIELPPAHRADLVIQTTERVRPPRHHIVTPTQ